MSRAGRAGRAVRTRPRITTARITTARRAAVVILAALTAALGTTGCGSSEPAPTPSATVEVAGDTSVRPTITIPDGFTVTEPSDRVLVAGDGPELMDGQSVLVDYVAVDAATGEVVADTYATLPEVRTLDPDALGGPLYELLDGARVGDRLELVELGTASNPHPHVIVVDVRATRANGEEMPAEETLPAVTRGEDGTPTVAPGAGSPPTSVTSVTLVRGTGPQVQVGQTVVIQLVATRWSDGEILDTTWDDAPRVVPLADLGTGLASGLVERTVGSQVLVVVPDPDNVADATVYVVDILATADIALGTHE